MATREEIREGIARHIFIWHIGNPRMWDEKWDEPNHMPSWEGPPREEYYEAADMVMNLEHSQGVVIKDERELPEWFKFKWCGTQSEEIFVDDIKETGYVSVIPLIEGKEK